MSNVFISYRREDSAPYAGRLCDRLGDAFGSHRVFMDVEDIAPGTDYTRAIQSTVRQCDVLVAVIGPRWLELLRSRAGERDFVAEEIAEALRRRIPVIPALVGGAAMPAAKDLPPALSELARRQELTFHDEDFSQKTSELIRVVRSRTAGGRSARRLAWTLVAIGVLIAIGGSAIFLIDARNRASLDGSWIARMQRPGGRAYNIRMQFRTAGTSLEGEVAYPTGTAGIQGGSFDGERLTFFTRHVPQFESESATITFAGEMEGRELRLSATTPDGIVTTGTAKKTE
jgi:hypothetical protein